MNQPTAVEEINQINRLELLSNQVTNIRRSLNNLETWFQEEYEYSKQHDQDTDELKEDYEKAKKAMADLDMGLFQDLALVKEVAEGN